MKNVFLFLCFFLWCIVAFGQKTYTRQDTLRGSNGRGRSWWDVHQYRLSIDLDTANKSINGINEINLKIVQTPADSLQLDLQEPMILDSVIYEGKNLDFAREGNVFWIKNGFSKLHVGESKTLEVYYHGSPRKAVNPPWDGGFIWTKDSLGNPWIAVACQGLGASCWWPCKDYQGDEPDNGMIIEMSDKIDAGNLICNGKQTSDTLEVDVATLSSQQYVVTYRSYFTIWNSINTYDVTFYIGDYARLSDTLMGEKGKLDLTFCPLKYNEAKAREQFKVVKQMLHCYEYWLGPYPFYEDGYKLVEAPYLGMEHQSAVAYGNKYMMGYLGRDRSHTGVGMNFDFIIVHESGHEWFGNNITAKDIADNWLHEGFTTYTETLFAEWILGKEKAFEYCRGEWQNIRNDRPVIGDYGVNDEGSSDKYDKGAAVVHMIRMIMNDDEQFRQLLRGLNRDFYHQTVTSKQVEDYISRFAHYDFAPLFDEYLRTTMIPELEYYIRHKKLFYRFTNVVKGFTLPMEVQSSNKTEKINPTADWQYVKWKGGFDVSFSENFLYKVN